MQYTSAQYKKSMRGPDRNRGYIRITIGVVNSAAQQSIKLSPESDVTFFSDANKPFRGFAVEKRYATCEEQFSKVDGSMYFLPPEELQYNLYNNGIVTNDILGSVILEFDNEQVFDIKGLTINFGECYPVEFTIDNGSGIVKYTNNSPKFVTEDVFENTKRIVISPIKMSNNNGRLRVYEFTCGIANTFTNQEVFSYSSKEYVSPISDTLPSSDVSFSVDNSNQYYSADNPESTLGYMEEGQEVKVSFGYDIDGKGTIEWLPENTTYLKSWSSNDTSAKFSSTDRFDYLTGTFYKGIYREGGISLYDLAEEVLQDAGITDPREYYIDPYLKYVIVRNPIPVVKHSEALQIIANAGRCVLYEDRESRIHIQSSFVPDMSVETNGETEYSHSKTILQSNEKSAYAIASYDFSKVDETVFFMPADQNYLNTGYISSAISNENGIFDIEPVVTVKLEAAYVAYGIKIHFTNVAPSEMKVTTYNDGSVSEELLISDISLITYIDKQFRTFDKVTFQITKGAPNSRVAIDYIDIGGSTDYVLSRSSLLSDNPEAERQKKVKGISVYKTAYALNNTEIEISSNKERIAANDPYTVVYLTEPFRDFRVSVVEPVSAEVIESSNFYVKLKFIGITTDSDIEYKLHGKKYEVQESIYRKSYGVNGEDIHWKNPLIGNDIQASDIEKWLAIYFLGDVDYSIKWRGDPAVDANDLFYLELKNREKTIVRSYQNELSFSGAWSGKMKARKVVL